jgi:hypothetical protein
MTPLLRAAGAFVDRIKINTMTREVREGRAVWIKRRRFLSRPILSVANGFFRLAGNPVQALTDLAAWRRWEIECFEHLHGEGFRAFADGPRAVGADELPGVSLTVPLDTGALTPAMSAAAAREMRRAHAWQCAALPAGWSHGDPHLANFIYDAAEDRARLIDFEVRHDPRLSAEERHADDLLVFLQDMVGRIRTDLWLPNARAFLVAYDRPGIVALLQQKLSVPRGLPGLWWKVRTTWLPRRELEERLAALLRA